MLPTQPTSAQHIGHLGQQETHTGPLPSPSPSDEPPKQSPFLRLPTEIRLQIYGLLVLPRKSTDLLPSRVKVSSSAADSFDYEKKQHGTDRPAMADPCRPVLCIRTIDGDCYEQRYGKNMSRSSHTRSVYAIRADRFRARCMNTTYHCVNIPRIEDHMGIIRTNKQIHAEVAELLYSSYTFDFDTHVEAIRPFLNDLTPFARSCIKSVRFVKKGLAYDKEFDRAEWTSAMRYLTASSSDLSLRRLELGIVAGRPGPNGWDRIAKYAPQDFDLLKDADGMQWLQYLLEFKDLVELDVNAIVEHCAHATNSMAMANFIRFSASIESGFSKYLRKQLLCV
ncbi:uncharacterized protein LTR77_005428 [Saxophila tyrrhenica]|uniref:Uncharacterized protein n=1 Tax=Saxophila tyrrhenica TaxID=1690608 RepID=A0AAV9P912_9PEZI|nr:hypothetical protein LTR77_005428 [Saxophila tyrrhenica]